MQAVARPWCLVILRSEAISTLLALIWWSPIFSRPRSGLLEPKGGGFFTLSRLRFSAWIISSCFPVWIGDPLTEFVLWRALRMLMDPSGCLRCFLMFFDLEGEFVFMILSIF